MSARARSKTAAVLLCLAIVGLTSCGTSGKEVSSASGGDGTEEATTTAAEGDAASEEEAEPQEEDTTTTEAEADGATIEVAETGFSLYTAYDDSTEATAAAVLTNTGDAPAEFFEVIFSFKDANGKPVGTETDTVYAVAPGETGYAVVDMVELTGEPATVEATAVVDEDSFIEVAALPVSVEGVAPEEYGDGVQVNGIAENKSDDIYEYFTVTCVLRSGGKIVGGARGSLDTLVPGGSITWTATGSAKADAAECAASGSL